MERKRKVKLQTVKGWPKPALQQAPGQILPAMHADLLPLIVGRKFWTDRGYDHVMGEYVYTLTIVLAEGEAAINDD